MPTLQEENTLRAQLKEKLGEMAKITPTVLARQDLGADLSFESGVIFFSRTLRLFHALNESDLGDIPYQKTQELLQQATDTLTRCRQIQEFALQKHPNNPMGVRDQFINQFRDTYDGTFNAVAPMVAFTVRKGVDFARLEEQGRAILERIEGVSAGHEKAMQAARTTAENLVEEVRKIVQEAGVSQHAIHFKQEAEAHESAAKPWLTVTAWLGGFTVLVGFGLLITYLIISPNLTATQSLQLAISKIVIFSAMLSATFWTGRTYRAHRHNAVLNRHRQNALATFQAFAKAASDDQTKNAVLLQATQCIFSPQQTGYVTGESETGNFSQILEIVRSVGK